MTYKDKVRSLMFLDEYDDELLFYRIACDCKDQEHDVSLMFTNDDGFPSMLLTAYPSKTYHRNIFQKIWYRIKDTLTLLIKGDTVTYIEFMLNKDNIEAFEEALKQAKEKLWNSK